jgi:hypothetical protein
MYMGAINRTNIADHLIRHQLEMVGRTWEEAQKDDMWFFNWTMTKEQAHQFRGYALPLIKKVFKCNKRRAEGIFSWFFLEFGLRVKD